MVQFRSILGQSIFGQIRSYTQISNFVENFRLGIVRFGSIRILGPLSGENVSGVKSGMGPGRAVRVSDLGSVLVALPLELEGGFLD